MLIKELKKRLLNLINNSVEFSAMLNEINHFNVN